ncbi:MAG TPA: ribonuclease H [Chloroflexi bacterium]|nr:ribonuclease H [Chloroflexota bacterium]
MMERFVVHVDGAVGPDGGRRGAGLAAVIRDEEGRIRHLLKEWLRGPVTNVEAEYGALLLALRALVPMAPCEVVIRSDSQVMVNQIVGRYRVGSAGLRPLHQEACALIQGFPRVEVEFVPREQNRLADALAWEAANGWEQKEV